MASLVFTVDLTFASVDVITVQFTTSDDTATAGVDYTTVDQTLTFAPGTTTQTVSVPVIVDDVAELSESLFVTLSSAVNALIADSQGFGIIVDDDPSFVEQPEHFAVAMTLLRCTRAVGVIPTR